MGLEVSGSGTWPLAFYQSEDGTHLERWVPGKGRKDVKAFLNNYDNLQRALTQPSSPEKEHRDQQMRVTDLLKAGLLRLRNFIKLIGGTMTFHPGGAGGGGEWELELWGKTDRVPVRNDQVNRLDRLYISNVKNPTTWQDYESPGTLVDTVFWELIALFK